MVCFPHSIRTWSIKRKAFNRLKGTTTTKTGNFNVHHQNLTKNRSDAVFADLVQAVPSVIVRMRSLRSRYRERRGGDVWDERKTVQSAPRY